MTANEMITNILQKQIKCQEKKDNLTTENNIRQLPTKKRKKIFVVDDSTIKNITDMGISSLTLRLQISARVIT